MKCRSFHLSILLIVLFGTTTCRVGFVGHSNSVDLTNAVRALLVGPSSIDAALCSGPYLILGLNESGEAPAPFVPDTKFLIGGAGETEIFLDSLCAENAPGSEIALPLSESHATFYLKMKQKSNVTLTVSASGLSNPSIALTVLPGAPTQLMISSDVNIAQNSCVEVKGILFDAAGSTTTARHDLNVRLFALGSAFGVYFYTNALCEAASRVTERPIPSGVDRFSVYTLAPTPGTLSLSFDPRDSGISEGTRNILVKPSGTPAITIAGLSTNIQAGQCVPLSTNARSNGNPLTVRSDITVQLRVTDSAGQFYVDTATCMLAVNGQNPAPITSTTIAAFSSSTTFLFRPLKAPATFTVEGITNSDFVNMSATGSTVPAPPASIQVLGVAPVIRAAECSGPVELKLRDLFNNEATAPQELIISLGATPLPPGQVITFYDSNNSNCMTPLPAPAMVSIPKDAKKTSYYFKAQNPVNSEITATRTGLTPGKTGLITIQNAQGNPDQLVLSTTTTTVTAGSCIDIKLSSRDGFGNSKDAPIGNANFLLSSNDSKAGFFLDGSCNSSITSVDLLAGTSEVGVFFKGKTSGLTTVTVTGPGVPAVTAQLALTVLSQTPSLLKFADVLNEVTKTECNGPISIKVEDSFGNRTKFSDTLNGTLISLQSGGGKFYSNQSCSNEIVSVNLPSGVSELGGLYYKAISVPTLVLVASASGVSSASQTVVVKAPPNTILTLTIDDQIKAGSCVPLLITSVLDEPLPPGSSPTPKIFDGVDVNLSSNSTHPPVFFSDNSCSQTLNPLQVKLDQDTNPATVYFKDTTAQNIRIDALPLFGPSSGSVSVQIVPDVPFVLNVDQNGNSRLTKNDCKGPYSISVRDAHGNNAPLTVSTPLTSSATGGDLEMYSNSQCTNTLLEIVSGTSQSNFYLKSTTIGGQTLTTTLATPLGSITTTSSWLVENASAVVTSISPNQGPLLGNTEITVSGSKFLAGIAVALGGKACTGIQLDSDTRLRCTIPSGNPGFVDVTLSNPNAEPSVLLNGFQYINSPIVDSVVPNFGPNDAPLMIAIHGSNFTSGATVKVGDDLCLNTNFVSNTHINCMTPVTTNGFIGLVSITVKNPNGQSGTLNSAFRYQGPPSITSVAPHSGIETGGTVLSIVGSSFEPNASITVGGVACTMAVISPSLISCRTGIHAPGVADVVVTNPTPNIPSATAFGAFTFLGRPKITQIFPQEGSLLGGTAISIEGDHFDSQTIVQIGGSGCGNIRNLSSTFLTCDTPMSATVGMKDVTITNRTTELFTITNGFEYTFPPPIITRIVPDRAPDTGGAIIEIDGGNFKAGIAVTIGGVSCGNVNFQSANRIDCKLGIHPPGKADITVQNIPSGSTTVSQAFTYISVPVISSVSPQFGSTTGGNLIKIAGSDFLSNANVLVDTFACVSAIVVSPQEIRCVAPIHVEGSVRVTVINTDLGIATLANAYQYVSPPSITSVNPTTVPSAGGVLLTLNGTNLTAGLTVTIGGVSCTPVTLINVTQATCMLPPIPSGTANIVVTNSDGQSFTLSSALNVTPAPVVSSVSPSQIPSQGGATILIMGSNLSSGVIVTVGGQLCIGTTRLSSSQIQCQSPPVTVNPPGPIDINVTNPDGQTALVSGAITVVPAPEFAATSPITPTKGPATGGTLLTLAGQGFTSGASIKIGTTASVNCLNVSVVSSTLITCVTPANLSVGPQNIIVTNSDGQMVTLASGFIVDGPPQISGILPNHGPASGGLALTIMGQGFVNQTKVLFGVSDGTECTGMTLESANRITCTQPPLTAGAVSLKIQNPDGQFSTLSNSFVVDAPPIISSVTPNHGPATLSIVVSISGQSFRSGVTVTVGGQPCTSITRSEEGNLLTCRTPLVSPGLADVVVKNSDLQSATLTGGYTVDGAPTVTNINPSMGPATGSTVVKIIGSNFVEGARVKFNTSTCTNISVLGPNEIECVTSANVAGPVNVTVTNGDNQVGTLVNGYTYSPGPVITSIVPDVGPSTGGTAVMLTGERFTAGASILIGGFNCGNINIVSGTQATCVTPSHPSGSADVVIINPDTQRFTFSGAFTFDPPPKITSVTPTHGPATGGTFATLKGANFSSGTTLTLGGVTRNVTFVNDTTLTFTTVATPPGAISITVKNSDNQSITKTNAFTFDPPPSISSFTPSILLTTGNQTLTIQGDHFISGALISIGGSPCGSASITASTISCTTTVHGPGKATLKVTNPDGQFDSKPDAIEYRVPAPLVTSVAPNHGPAILNTDITISGSRFTELQRVTVGGNDCTNLQFVSASQLKCKVSPHAAGSVDVTVTDPFNQQSTLTGGFTFDPGPSLTSISPNSGPELGAALVILTGSNLTSSSVVTIGGFACPGELIATDQYRCVTPAKAPQGPLIVDVTVTNSDQQSVTLPGAYTYIPAPQLISVTPSQVPASGGTNLSLAGNFFRLGATIKIGAITSPIDCNSVTFGSSQVLSCTSPPLPSGPYAVKVTNPDGQSATLNNAVIVNAAPIVSSLTPNHGPMTGGTPVNVTGAHFVQGAIVVIGGRYCEYVSVVSSSSISCKTPFGGPAGSASVKVTNPDGQFGILQSGFTYDPPPIVSQFDPIVIPSSFSSFLTFSGTGFVSPTLVTIFKGSNPSVPCNIVSNTSIKIGCSVSDLPAGKYSIRVTNPDGQSALLTDALSVMQPPSVFSISPSRGTQLGGTSVNISGANFLPGISVKIGNSMCTSLSVLSESELRCSTSSGLPGIFDVKVTNADNQFGTLTNGYTYNAAPTISSVSPSNGASSGGTTLTVYGSGFLPQISANLAAADLNGAPCNNVANILPTSFTCVTSAHAAGPVNVRVTNSDLQMASTTNMPFTYLAPPVISSVTPNSGPMNSATQITVNGSDFQGGAMVTVGGNPCTELIFSSGSKLLCKAQPVTSAGSVAVTVTNPDGQSHTLNPGFTYIGPPLIQSVTPNNGPAPGGTAVIISGTGLALTASVVMDGSNCAISSISNTQIKCTTTAHLAGTVTVTVTRTDYQVGSLPSGFTYNPPPTLTSVLPNTAPQTVSQLVAFTGLNFVSGITAKFGGVNCTNTTFTSSSSFSCLTTVPFSSPGPVSITLTNPDGQFFTAPNAITIIAPPNVTSFSPSTGPAAGGTILTVNGTNFSTTATVKIDQTTCNNPTVSGGGTVIQCVTGAHVPAYSQVNVRNSDLQFGSSPAMFGYIAAPVVTSVIPISGTIAGGTRITVTGTGFQTSSPVLPGIKVGTLDCVNISVLTSGTALQCTTVADTAGVKSVTVKNPDLQLSNSNVTFTYVTPPIITSVTPNTGTMNGAILVQINGSNFRPGVTVSMGGVPCTVSSSIDSSIGCVTGPHAAGSVSVTVTNSDGTSVIKASGFTYVTQSAPVLSNFTPNSGPMSGYSTLTINGGGFDSTLSVTLGTDASGYSPCTSMTIVSSQTAICKTGPHAAGSVSVVATNASSLKTIIPGFNYTSQISTAISCNVPDWNNPATSCTGNIIGQGSMGSSDAPLVASQLCSQSGNLNGSCCMFHLYGIGEWFLTDGFQQTTKRTCVTNADGSQSDCLAGGACQPATSAPLIASGYPSISGTSGGGEYEISGQGFAADSIITIGTAVCSVKEFVSDKVIRCKTIPPKATSGTVDVTITNPTTGAISTPYKFTYISTPVVTTVTPGAGKAGITLRLEGTNLTSGTIVTIGGVACTSPAMVGDYGTCIVPTLPTEGYHNIVVTQSTGAQYTMVNGFSYETGTSTDGECVSFTQISLECGDSNNYEWSALWAPAITGLQNNGLKSPALDNLLSRLADANWSSCNRAPSPISAVYHPYPSIVTSLGNNFQPMTNGNMGSLQCPAFFSQLYSPLIVDINKEGIALTAPNEGVAFDILGEGYRNQVSWPTNPSNSMWLVLDRNNDNQIESIYEMFGNNTIGPDGKKALGGFQALEKYDTNADNTIDYRDSVFQDLKLWSDKNKDGRSNRSELLSLESKNIKNIDLNFIEVAERNDFYGNETLQRSVVSLQNKELRRIYDIWLAPGIRVKEPTLAELERIEETRRKKEIANATPGETTRSNRKPASRALSNDFDPLPKFELLRDPVFQNNMDLALRRKRGGKAPQYITRSDPFRPKKNLAKRIESKKKPILRALAETIQEKGSMKFIWVALGLVIVAAIATIIIRYKRRKGG